MSHQNIATRVWDGGPVKYQIITERTRVRESTLHRWHWESITKDVLPARTKRERPARRNSRVRRRDRYWAQLNEQKRFREACGL